MIIAGREIGLGHPPYVIAEVSCNHGGSLSRALELIDAAKDFGADAVKFQCVTADTITIDCDRPEFTIKDGPWRGRNLYELYQRTETPFEWFPTIAERARLAGITWFASVFDKTAVDLMVKLDAPAIKIASFELVDIPLIKYAVATGKPIILSTGMASYNEVNAAIPRGMDLNNLALLHCVSGYPSPASEANLYRIKHLQGMFSYWGEQAVGISDHGGPEIPIAATALGAQIIEKHFRLIAHPDTEDSPFSLDQWQFAEMVRNVRNTWLAIQQPLGSSKSEESSRPLRRSLFAVEYIIKGDLFTERNVRSIRPGHGLPPAVIGNVIGQVATRDIVRGEPLSWEMVAK
jgi:N-acetylneuraminate synthase